MAAVLVTGMSGTGKSCALAELARRGYRVVDTDYGGWTDDVPSADARGSERLWREDRIAALLAEHEDGVLFLSGCVANQGRVRPALRRGRAVERTCLGHPRARRRTQHE